MKNGLETWAMLWHTREEREGVMGEREKETEERECALLSLGQLSRFFYIYIKNQF